MATIHVADQQGGRVVGASVSVRQTTKDFPFGSAIASTILGNQAYQVRAASRQCKESVEKRG